MTWIDLVRKHFPDADDQFCKYILWELTPFPVVEDAVEIEKYIIKAKKNNEN